MFKFNRLAGVLLVCGSVSIAAAATLKMKWFNWTDGIGDKDGVATLHYVSGQNITKIHVTITGFEPDVAYGVAIDDGDIDTGVANGIRTNNGGNGEVSLFNAGDITGESRSIKIYEDDNNDGYYNAGEEVAEGTAQ